jgi:hypothetical protein
MPKLQNCSWTVGAGKPKKSVLTQQGRCEEEKMQANITAEKQYGKAETVPAPFWN